MRNSKGQFVKGGHYNPKRNNWRIIICPCGSKIKARLSRIKIGKEKYCSKKCSDKFRIRNIWNKGKFDLDTYYGLHNWVSQTLGKPKKCAHCNTTTAKYFEWSNKSGKYKKSLDDWQRLCRKCHMIYDFQKFNIRKEIFQLKY